MLSGISPDQIIQAGGILLVAFVIFAESGLLVGFFLPGDTLLFGAGLAASQGRLSLFWLIVAVSVAAIIGDNVGYSIGKRTGHRVFNKKEGILFQKEHVARAERFYKDHGGKTIIVARFVPIVRTFAPVVAGIGKMPRRQFMSYNIVGALLWCTIMPLLGFYLGSKIPHLDQYIEFVFIFIVIASFALSFGHLLLQKNSRRIIKERLVRFFSKMR